MLPFWEAIVLLHRDAERRLTAAGAPPGQQRLLHIICQVLLSPAVHGRPYISTPTCVFPQFTATYPTKPVILSSSSSHGPTMTLTPSK